MNIYICEKIEGKPSKLIEKYHNVRSIKIINNTLEIAWVDYVYTKDYKGLEPYPVDYPNVRENDCHIGAENIDLKGKEIFFKGEINLI